MAEKMQVYKCSTCGNIVEILHEGAGQLVCCGEPMNLLAEKTKDAGLEKHVPVVEKVGGKIKVKVGSVAHPMEQNHYIEWIEITMNGKSCRKFLKPGEKPEAYFETANEKVKAREYCSIHGLWKS